LKFVPNGKTASYQKAYYGKKGVLLSMIKKSVVLLIIFALFALALLPLYKKMPAKTVVQK